ncbi:MAG: DUF3122 domain-containing protein [Xenococcaceae cyanobacterium MO_188.B32]|nr:DUF3122 domain-containing protein [Xenococcaceae cyanobacterium MO_188.B32]
MNKINWLILLVCFSIFLCFGSIAICLPATAVLRQHHENSGVLHYHAHSSLRDKQGMTWQVILFPEYQADIITKYHLRLVGFPGIAEFIHPQPLEIITAKGEIFNAADLNAVSSPAPNVGEFDLTDILPILPEKGSLKLSTILQNNGDLSLKIPESILIEWKLLAREVS